MKTKTMTLILLLLALVMALPSVSSASDAGIFGQMAQNEYADHRLSLLDQVAEKVAAPVTADNGITFEVGQAFYTGDLVFIAYRISPATDLIVLHEGAPDVSIEWYNVIEDWVEGEVPAWDPDVKKEHDWLDGKSQRWLESPRCVIRDGFTLADGTAVAYTGGTEMRLEDGSILGWRECKIPADKVANTLTLTVGVDSFTSIRFQDHRTFKLSNGDSTPAAVTFTLHLVDDPLAVKVLAPAEDSAANG